MKTTTQSPAIPATIKLTVINKWLDESDPKNPQIRFTLAISNGGQSMQCDYSGGMLAFLSVPDSVTDAGQRKGKEKQRSNLRTAYNRPVRVLDDETCHNTAKAEIYRLSAPDLKGVLYSLISDAEAGSETFPEFCGNYGYDEDSRKAFATWQACQENGAKLRRVLGADFDTVAEAVRDY